MISAKIIADSVSPFGKRITTMQLKYPRFIHGEFMTHRVFSRNAASSRAIPVAKMISQVWKSPATPIHWGANQAGMQAKDELAGYKKAIAKGLWKTAGRLAAMTAYGMTKVGLHKQVSNRILEPFQWMETVVTATEWDNFFELRAHPDAQPEIQALAVAMRDAMNESEPVERPFHLPYLTERELTQVTPESFFTVWAPVSAARCARVSYLKHDGESPSFEDDMKLFERLLGSQPFHASPAEHQAFIEVNFTYQSRNFMDWTQFREYAESEHYHPGHSNGYKYNLQKIWENFYGSN